MTAHPGYIYTHTCNECREKFESLAANAQWCKKEPCQLAKKRHHAIKHREQNNIAIRKVRVSGRKFNRKCQNILGEGGPTERVCGKPTGYNYFFCAACHSTISDSGIAI